MRGSGTRSSTVSRRSPPSVSGSGSTAKDGIAGLGASGPKYFATHARAWAGSTSPTIERTALLGAYQVRKKELTSSSDAASRSSIEPIVGW